MNGPQILGANGQPIVSRPSMLNGSRSVAYDAADRTSDHMADWMPYLGSADSNINGHRDIIVARVRDMVRNDGWASGVVTRALDSAIGANFRPVFKPDWQALRAFTGNKAFDHVWADEFAQVAEAGYRHWANDIGRYCDVERKQTLAQMMWLGFRHKLVDGDALAMIHWRENRIGEGKARYATAIQMIDPDRLSNPQQQFDQSYMRGGVEIDDDGVAVAYHIRRAHPGDYYNADKSVTWDRIPRETDWGRPIIVHDFDYEQAGQHRGGAGIFAPVMQRLKMLIKYDGSELDASIINAIFAAYIESPFDQESVEAAMSGGESEVSAYQRERTEFHEDRRISLNGARMPTLFPGEKIATVNATRPNANFKEFEAAMLRNVAAGTGLSAQQVSNNWSDVNYSSARAAALEAWKTLSRRRNNYAIGFGQQFVCAIIEEMMDVDPMPLPANAPPFIACREGYARTKWMGPGRGMIDGLKELQGAVLGMDAGLATLEDQAAEISGTDWRDTLGQRAVEVARFRELGLPLPDWAGGVPITDE